ncbi:MAG TPA: peptidase MA family metallohydrolase [Candidatus Limnocylindria bacterium]|nr:peptidase MA family metallohydrolase [Candidatus Limnocylindria bacterium]
MGRLTRWLLAAALACAVGVIAADAAAAFDGFGTLEADSTYGQNITFDVSLDGGAPDELELLLRTPGSDAAFVVPVDASGTRASYVWNTAVDYVTPNTLVTYQWRAFDGDEVTVSDEATIRYDDDRPGLDWQSRQLGEATVHWYGDAEAQAVRFGELTALGVERGEERLGTTLAGPVDVFVYASRDAFFGALGPGAREWTGAAAFSEIRTIFMWNSAEAGSQAYLETAMVHEVTHIVFHDATDNPFHEPARWLNEGIATWSEAGDAGGDRAIVENEASGGGLFAFDAITEQFPIGERGGRLSYAQGTTMVDLIVDTYGPEALARITAAYRDGASDAEALEAGTGIPADELYADYYSSFGVEAPTPIAPGAIAPSNVDRPTAGEVDPGGVDPDAERPPDEGSPSEGGAPSGGGFDVGLVVLLAAASVAAGLAAVAVSRRAERRARS